MLVLVFGVDDAGGSEEKNHRGKNICGGNRKFLGPWHSDLT
jgi:hypothetical protein